MKETKQSAIKVMYDFNPQKKIFLTYEIKIRPAWKSTSEPFADL